MFLLFSVWTEMSSFWLLLFIVKLYSWINIFKLQMLYLDNWLAIQESCPIRFQFIFIKRACLILCFLLWYFYRFNLINELNLIYNLYKIFWGKLRNQAKLDTTKKLWDLFLHIFWVPLQKLQGRRLGPMKFWVFTNVYFLRL